ncbi:MAG: hypothetical protein AAFR44_04880 [Pseudomonadota bacterium]
MSQYFHLKANVPYLGEQLVGYLYTDPARAMALQVALRQCPGAQYVLTDDQGSPVMPAYGGGGGGGQGGNPFPWLQGQGGSGGQPAGGQGNPFPWLPQALNPWGGNQGGGGHGHGGGGGGGWGY